MTIPFLLSIAAALTGPALGGPRQPRPALVEMIGRPDFERILATNGMSQKAIAALRRLRPEEPIRDVRSAECAVIAAAAERPLDVMRLAAVLAQRDQAIADQATWRRTTLIAALGPLGQEDGAIFLRLVGTDFGTGRSEPPGPPPQDVGGRGERRPFDGRHGEQPPPPPLVHRTIQPVRRSHPSACAKEHRGLGDVERR